MLSSYTTLVVCKPCAVGSGGLSAWQVALACPLLACSYAARLRVMHLCPRWARSSSQEWRARCASAAQRGSLHSASGQRWRPSLTGCFGAQPCQTVCGPLSRACLPLQLCGPLEQCMPATACSVEFECKAQTEHYIRCLGQVSGSGLGRTLLIELLLVSAAPVCG
jgi:hypothetical protein